MALALTAHVPALLAWLAAGWCDIYRGHSSDQVVRAIRTRMHTTNNLIKNLDRLSDCAPAIRPLVGGQPAAT